MKRFSRRSTVVGLGLSGLSLFVGTAGTAAAEDGLGLRQPGRGEFDVVTLREDERREYQLDDGESFENVLIDQTAPGSSLSVRTSYSGNSDWEIRNVGFHGVGHVGDSENVFQMPVGAPEGSEGVIENVFMDVRSPPGEGDPDPHPTEIGGMFTWRPHAGHIDVCHTFVAGMGNNAAYMSNSGKDPFAGDGSTVHRNCYHRDNTVGNFRIGTPGSAVHNCVGIIHDPKGRRGFYPSTTSQRARCVWGRHHEGQLVENCSFYYSGDDVQRPGSQAFHASHLEDRSLGDRAELIVRDCNINEDVPEGELYQEDGDAEVVFENLGHEPTVDVLEDGGVPTSAEMAARGNRELPDPDEFS